MIRSSNSFVLGSRSETILFAAAAVVDDADEAIADTVPLCSDPET